MKQADKKNHHFLLRHWIISHKTSCLPHLSFHNVVSNLWLVRIASSSWQIKNSLIRHITCRLHKSQLRHVQKYFFKNCFHRIIPNQTNQVVLQFTTKSSLGTLKNLSLPKNHDSKKKITTATKINLSPYSKSSVADKRVEINLETVHLLEQII